MMPPRAPPNERRRLNARRAHHLREIASSSTGFSHTSHCGGVDGRSGLADDDLRRGAHPPLSEEVQISSGSTSLAPLVVEVLAPVAPRSKIGAAACCGAGESAEPVMSAGDHLGLDANATVETYTSPSATPHNKAADGGDEHEEEAGDEEPDARFELLHPCKLLLLFLIDDGPLILAILLSRE
ncbi:hypothetical protein CMUS01_06355 [Colletotrichum musicola]|uniref:Uncharacterized protein n=1 Tax=Colletotrichum musicola TaxID=2175873 RepID=A0A8H6KLY8_9PEZI|nr:hypothetical protein CMUS01_06355 [Colletotrichum musicola]